MMKGRTIVSIAAAIALLGGLALAVWLVRFVHSQDIPFDTDEADHALPALDLFTAVRRGGPIGVGRAIAAQAFYPPVHSLFGSVSMLLLGPTHFAARVPSVLFFWAAAMVVAWASYRHVRSRGGSATWLPLGAATITFVLAITSPEAIHNGVLCMLEPLGTLWCALLLGIAVRDDGSAASRRVFGLASLTIVITLTKYSFGIVAIAAVGGALLLHQSPGGWRTALRRALWFGVCVGAALCVWFLITDPHSVWRFLTGHTNDVSPLSTANLLFDVRAWYRGYFVAPLVSLAVLPLIAAAIYFERSLFPVRLAGLLLLFAEVTALASGTNEMRHSLFALPAAWYLSGVGAAVLLERIASARSRGKEPHEAGADWRPASIALFVLLVAFWGGQRFPGLGRELRQSLEGLAEFAELQEEIAAHVDAAAPILAHGFTDQFSMQGMRFVLARGAGVPSTALQLDEFPFRRRNYLHALDRKRHIDRPFLDPTFPRAPLSAVVEHGYYRYAVQLQRMSDAGDRKAEVEELRDTLARFPNASRNAGDWRVVIWDLR
jgi:hypothetical protein